MATLIKGIRFDSSFDDLVLFTKKSKYSKVFILTDDNTYKYCLRFINKKIKGRILINIHPGEQHKNLDTCKVVWQTLLDHRADRNALIINLGGGVISDLGGFVASTYKRGIHFIQIPTTLLAMVDASIGGKSGIDFEQLKNVIGSFNAPQKVFINPVFLKTLPDEQLLNGLAEVIKHALIADKLLWQNIQHIGKDFKHTNWKPLIEKSIKIKTKIVNVDPYESGKRKALNFGHTIGHAVESYFLSVSAKTLSLRKTNKELLHGYAVALGMICESYLSLLKSGLTKKELDIIVTYILKLYPKQNIPVSTHNELLKIMKQDKKNTNNQINFTLLKNIGTFKINQICNEEEIKKSLSFYQNL